MVNSYAMVVKTGSKYARISQNAPKAPELKMEHFPPFTTSKPDITMEMAGSDIRMPKWKEQKMNTDVMELLEAVGANSSRDERLNDTALKFKCLVTEEYPDMQVIMTGSHPAGVDLKSSDLDFVLYDPTLDETSTAFQNLKALKYRLMDYLTYLNIYVKKSSLPVLRMVDEDTGISIDATYSKCPSRQNTQLLVYYGQIDKRFQPLCRALKYWANDTGVVNSRDGRLNSFTLCLLVIHYLQSGVTPAVLPNLQELFPDLDEDLNIENDHYEKRNLLEEMIQKGIPLTSNKSSLGELYWGFMKYYAEFDFESKYISIKRGGSFEKKRDDKGFPLDGLPYNNQLIVVVDPNLAEPFNCARTVRQENIFERIKNEFVLAEREIRKNHRISRMKSLRRAKIDEYGVKRDLEEMRRPCFGWYEQNQEERSKVLYRHHPSCFYVEKPDESWPRVNNALFVVEVERPPAPVKDYSHLFPSENVVLSEL